MRILYMHRSLADGGEGVHIRSMVAAFRDRGHEVRVLGPGGAALGDPGAVTSRTRASATLSRLPPAAVELGEVAYGFVDRWRGRAVARSWEPDLVYARHGAYTWAPVAAAAAARAPVLLEVNAPLALERSRDELRPLRFARLATAVERRCFEGVDRILAVSTPLRDYLVQEMGVETPVTVIPNAIDPEPYRNLPDGSDARRRLGIDAGEVVVGVVGFIREWHGLDLLAGAVGRVARESSTPIVLLVVGDGPALPDLQRQAPSVAAPARMLFTGRVEHAAVPGLLAAFDIAVSPRTTFYASPLKLVEYLAAGRAVVAPHRDNVVDLLEPGEEGLTFPPEDVDALAEAIGALAANASLRRRLGEAARRRTLRERTWDHNAARVEELAQQVAPT